MSVMNVIRHRYFTWAILALPAIGMSFGLSSGNVTPHELLHPTGEFSVRAMLLALFCSPLVLLFPRVKIFKSLTRRRRYLGVAAFGYGLFHTVLYLIDKGTLADILGEALLLPIWTGWVAFLIFVPLAATSHDAMVRKLGARRWKNLQRLTYAAAVLTAAHWLFLDYEWGPVLVHFVPLAALEIARIVKMRSGSKPEQVAV
ncbi:MAG: ferric reductase-like transmembrane domain-containing protein [Marinomonas sp.]